MAYESKSIFDYASPYVYITVNGGYAFLSTIPDDIKERFLKHYQKIIDSLPAGKYIDDDILYGRVDYTKK